MNGVFDKIYAILCCEIFICLPTSSFMNTNTSQRIYSKANVFERGANVPDRPKMTIKIAAIVPENIARPCAIREVAEFTSGEGPGIFVRGGENFDEAPPAGGVKFKVAPLP